MPFTPTHVLAALPIASWWSPQSALSALIIGTMVPDWPLYVPVSPAYGETHSLPGLFTACLPIGFALVVFYNVALKRALFELVPDGLKRRLARYVDEPPNFRWRTLAVIVAAVLIGAATHLLWDSFTHIDTLGVRMFPALNQTLFSVGDMDVAGYMALQHGSTLVGFPVLVLVFVTWYRKAAEFEIPRALLGPIAIVGWRFVLLAIPAALMILTTIKCASANSIQTAVYLLIQGVTSTGLIFLELLACYALYFALAIRIGSLAKAPS